MLLTIYIPAGEENRLTEEYRHLMLVLGRLDFSPQYTVHLTDQHGQTHAFRAMTVCYSVTILGDT